MAWMYLYLVITLVKVHFSKEGSPAQHVNSIINAWDGICVNIYGFVEHVVVNTYPKYTLFLMKEQYGCPKKAG